VINVANDIWRIGTLPFWGVNAYLAGDILIDAGINIERRHFLRKLKGIDLKMVALTHVHPDHQGVAHAVCEAFGCPLACHEADRAAMEGREPMGPPTRAIRWSSNLLSGPPHRVDRVLQDGDMLGDFRVIHAPGHTMGQVMFFRESDRVVIAGDVLANMNFITLRPGLREPPDFFSVDRMLNRKSIRKLVDLKPELVLFGHGPPLGNAREYLPQIANRLKC
jgi:hydroxyacylglutathione hydrolase